VPGVTDDESFKFPSQIGDSGCCQSGGIGDLYRGIKTAGASNNRDTTSILTTMIPEAALELSVEQLISALNKKLFMEYARVHGEMPPMSRALVATLSAEVRSQEPKGNIKC